MSTKLILITLACITLALTSPAIAQDKKKKGGKSSSSRASTISKGIYGLAVDAVDVQNKTISVKINNVPSVINLHPSYKIFMYQGTVTLEHFADIAVGKMFRISLTGVKDGYTCDQIWDGVAFDAYKKNAAHAVGRILDIDVDYLRVENFVFRLNKDTKYRRNGKDKRNNPFTEGMRVSVISTPAGSTDQTPFAKNVSDVDIKPLGQGVKDSIKKSDKKVSTRAKDKLKSGTSSTSSTSGDRPEVKPKGSPKGGGK